MIMANIHNEFRNAPLARSTCAKRLTNENGFCLRAESLSAWRRADASTPLRWVCGRLRPICAFRGEGFFQPSVVSADQMVPAGTVTAVIATGSRDAATVIVYVAMTVGGGG